MPVLDVVREEIDADAVIPDAQDKPEADSAFVCSACGDSFSSQRGLNVHAGHAHPDHPELQVKSTRRRTTRKTDYKKPESTDEKIAKWQRFIENDVNNWLLIGATTPFVGIPAAALLLKPPSLGGATVGDRIRFSSIEAHVLARTAVTVEQNPQAAQLISAASALLPYALIIASVGIVAIHTYGVWRLRSDLPAMMQSMTASKSDESANGKQPRSTQADTTKPQFALI